MPVLVLASSSPYRRDLLARIVGEFDTLAPQVDETLALEEHPRDAVLRLAGAKAAAVAAQRPDAVVLAGDQLADLAGRPLGKPADTAEACRMLADLSGHTLIYYTALVLVVPGENEPLLHLDTSRVSLRDLTSDEIARYVARERPFDCAGALRLEASGIALCKSVETSDPTALIGLPLVSATRMLRGCGFVIP